MGVSPLVRLSDVDTVTINVLEHAPVATGGSFSVVHDHPLTIPAGFDAEGDTLTATVVTNVQHGTLTFNAATKSFTYTPTASYTGSDSFTYTLSDGVLTTASVTLTLAVQQSAPVAFNVLAGAGAAMTGLSITAVGATWLEAGGVELPHAAAPNDSTSAADKPNTNRKGDRITIHLSLYVCLHSVDPRRSESGIFRVNRQR